MQRAMNFALGSAGAPWVTIRVEDRDVYFHALERAQVDAEFRPLVDLHSRYFSEAPRLPSPT